MANSKLGAESARCNSNVLKLPTAGQPRVRQTASRDFRLRFLESEALAIKPIVEAARAAKQRSTVLRADVPPFDYHNPAHLRAWESIYDLGMSSVKAESPSD